MSWHPDPTDIQSFVDGELDAHARHGVAAHLHGCAACRAVAARVQRIAAALHAVPRAPLPPGLHDRVLAAVATAARVVEPACAECAEMASAYVDGELLGVERDAFEAHVYGCAQCFAVLKHTERAAEALRTIPRREAPADLGERITAAVAAEQGAARRFTWRRVVALGAGVAAAAAVIATLLTPGAQAPDPGAAPGPVVAEKPLEPAGTEPVMAAAPAGEVAATAVAAATAEPELQPAPTARRATGARGTRVAETPRRAPASAHATVSPTGDGDDARLAEAPVAVPPSRVLPTEDTRPVTMPPPAPRMTAGPRPGPVSSAPGAAALAPAPPAATAHPAPAPPAETAIALAPRTTGPDVRGVGSVTAPAPPAPVATDAGGDDEPVRLASLVPQQRGARTLYRAPSEPASGAIDRARDALTRGRSSAFDDPRTGIELR